MVQQVKETGMTRRWGWRKPKRGLGLLLTDTGLALAQSQAATPSGQQHCAWHWHGCAVRESAEGMAAWPAPGQLRQALARSGFQAQATALAVPEAQLQRFSMVIEPGLSKPQVHAAIAAQLAGLLSGPLKEMVWDFALQSTPPASAPATNPQPAWLQAAMQTQTSQTADVLVISRAWAKACEQWCQAAGLQLVRLEPAWQASSRWQVFLQSHEDQSSEGAALALNQQQQAVLGGLALGVVMP
jgi:hypothetical protein